MSSMVNTISFETGAGDIRALRNALGRFATGVTVVTTCSPDGTLVGMTANSFSSVSLDPPLVLWSLRRNATSLPAFSAAGHFAVNVLSAKQETLSNHFAKSGPDKFKGIDFETGLHGCPLLPDTLATFECRLDRELDGGDHVIILGRVLRATYRDGEPLIFAAGSYCRIER